MEKNHDILPRSFGTHDGAFHADEVTACALLLYTHVIDESRIVRTRDPALLSRCEYVCDVGGEYNAESKRFDHHQSTYIGTFSSAGMVLEYLRTMSLIQEDEVALLRSSCIDGVDLHDNGCSPNIPGFCSFSHVISNFTLPQYDASHEEQTKAFMRAVAFVVGHITRILERHAYVKSCREDVIEAMSAQGDILMFHRAIPWIDSFFACGGESHLASFVIMPMDGTWKARGIPPSSAERMRVRIPFPIEWAGLHDEELQAVSKIPGAIFCHKGGFVSVWNTKEEAIRAVAYVLQHQKRL